MNFAYLINAVEAAWFMCGLMILLAKVRGWRVPSLCRSFFHEFKPFFVPLLILQIGIEVSQGMYRPGNVVGDSMSLYAYWYYKDIKDDDDRWKRRREKASEVIKRIGSRLVLVPAPAPSN